jgi:hypothetical protein
MTAKQSRQFADAVNLFDVGANQSGRLTPNLHATAPLNIAAVVRVQVNVPDACCAHPSASNHRSSAQPNGK